MTRREQQMATFKVFVCLVYLCSFLIKQTEQCIIQTGSNSQDLPSFTDYGNNGVTRITFHHQAIIPSYEFADCCGNITEWGVDVQQGGGGDNRLYTLDLQVWRPSPTVDGSTGAGQYMLVGNNRFTSITLDNNVAQVTPLPRDQVQFRPGDVLGFYVEDARDNVRGVNVITTDIFRSETVWYASVTTLNTMACPVSAGSSGVLNTLLQGAPVISIETDTYNCPQITSTPPPCPTATSSVNPIDTTTTPQPTMPPTVPTDPVSMATTTTEPVTEEPTSPEPVTEEPTSTEPVTEEPTLMEPVTREVSSTNPVTDDFTTPEAVTDNLEPISLAPTPTETLANINVPTGPVPVNNSGGGGSDATVIAIVVIVIFFAIIIAVLVSVLIAVILVKKRGKKFFITRANLQVGISNQLFDQSTNVNNGTYDYVDENVSTVGYERSSERVVINENADNRCTYHQTVLYHSAGPNASSKVKPLNSDTDEHIYEDDVLYHESDIAAQVAMDPVYEDPPLSQEPLHYEMPQPGLVNDAGIYTYHVPTDAERKGSRKGSASYQPMEYNKLQFFVEESIYWAPASTTSDLYSQLASKKYREIPRKQLNILEQLGSGEFGQVCKAVWSLSGSTKELAVKTLRAELPEEEKVRFLQEAAIMGQFSHPNVVKLYGVVTVGDPVMICLELMENGDLRHYLCSIALTKESAKELKMQFVRFSKQIASGMNYLAKKSFVHRDLAARNVLLDSGINCKIGDFGLARDLMYETYYTPSTKGGKLPIKWMAPEALLFKKYSTDSDVWSYGMVLFEIWSVGKKPFSQISNIEVLKRINTGYIQAPPPGCPRAIYQLMVDCWNPVHSKRPSFADICRYLSASNEILLQWVEESDSLQVGNLGAPLSEADALYRDLQNVYVDTQ